MWRNSSGGAEKRKQRRIKDIKSFYKQKNVAC